MVVIRHALSQPSFILYIYCQAAMTMSSAMHFKYALHWHQIEFKVRLYSERRSREYGAWKSEVCEKRRTDQQAWALMDNKDFKVRKVRVMQQRYRFPFILGSTSDSIFFFLFWASLGFVFLFDQSACSHIICCTSVQGNSSGAGVILTWQQVNSTHL